MELRILGPLDVRAGGRTVALGGAKPRAVPAVLALHANQPVSAERLAVALWGEDAPPSAVKTVQVYVAPPRSSTTTIAPRGSAAAHRDEHSHDPVDARLDATFFEPARTRSGIDAWNVALRDGAALSFEDAIAYALADGR
jgi:DNA-binding SARP family transcriptional activator